VGAGLYELKDAVRESVPVGALLVGTAVSFVIAYASIAWLLRFVAGHPISVFVPYRVVLGLVLVGLLASGAISAT
jgi:undecaprenyl-diphosphatase